MAEETVADYDIRSPASRTFLTVVGTLVVVVVVAGLVIGASILMRETKVSTSVVDLGDSGQIIVDATSADITVREGDADVVKLVAKVTSGVRKTSYRLGRRGDVIKAESGCQSWLSPGCGVSIVLEVPKGLPLVVNTASGDITAGDIQEGVLTVSSSSGDVKVDGLSVDEFSAQTGSGDISAVFADQPFAFKATTDDGDIMATIPTGRRTYDITARSKSGTVASTMDSDKNGEGFIRATTGSGNIRLSPS